MLWDFQAASFIFDADDEDDDNQDDDDDDDDQDFGGNDDIHRMDNMMFHV